MPTPSPADVAAVAGSNFGNKEQITVTEFGTPVITADPTHPDLTSEGKLLDKESLGIGATATSKSVRIIGKPSQSTMKTLWVSSDKAGSFVIQILLDESERDSGGNPVWRNLTDPGSPVAVVANILTRVDIFSLFRQMRIFYTNGADAAVVDAWVFSIA